ncbi:iron siderophore ABC transporter, periplasmic substrate-binding protein [Arcobacter venerupis]|uniref:Iron siderophore ABC transporter, periplasmic substrate-binding protein n=1 Tax=Arcobacter venerupis TaxID=1054033 RepID=A0AAE7B9B5_9BACT|nr:helical backbone metal receptor [Arcobacter venerupis]QKF66981.1 iron siderophore ABC transporter, periplasmic substrate-binding protein [Arcobacter venerupis]RWS50070.1 iron ABC transporter substrate-binding protein [Arcobacter venerupis]
MKKLLFILILCINLLGQERIVTLSPSINEIVFALGVGKNVVANTSYCDFPEESKAILKIGGYNNISLEKILETKPTVVIGQDYDEKLNSNLKALGIKTLSYKTNTISSIENTISELGDFFDKKEKAKELISNIDNALSSVNSIVENKKILIVISPKKSLSNQIYITGNFLYFEDIIKASGNKNAYNSSNQAQPVVNTEKIIGMNPDIIVLLTPFLDGKKQEQQEIINAWKQLPINAAKDDNIYTVDKLYAGIPSQRVEFFIKDFKKILENVRNKKLQ